MSALTGKLMGDPPPGRTPWSGVPKTTVQVAAPKRAYIAEDEALDPGAAVRATMAHPAAEESRASEWGEGVPTFRQTPVPPPLGVESDDTDGLRPVAAIPITGLTIKAPFTGEPIFENVDPATLLVDETYQRDLSPKSMALIEKIIQGWDWRRFKPPVVAFADGGLQIIDGQHTAIAAASHPDIRSIPVMVVEAPELEARALAFIGHNRDRLNVSAMQLHHAAVAAGDVSAKAIETVCARAGVNLVRSAYGQYKWKVGDSIAIGAIERMIQRHGDLKTVQVLLALVAAGLAPISAADIKAAEMLFTDPDYCDELEALPIGGADVAGAIRALGPSAMREAKVFAASHSVPLWKALGTVWFKKSKKRRRS